MIILFLLDLIWRKLKAKLGIKHCVSLAARKRLVAATLLSVLDYCDIIYIYIYICRHLSIVYRRWIQFISSFKLHHKFKIPYSSFLLYSRVG